jgi:hypothetical protein
MMPEQNWIKQLSEVIGVKLMKTMEKQVLLTETSSA